MSDTLDDAFRELQREYIAEAPARLAELRKDAAALAAGEADAIASLATRFHRLAGSGGSYGFPTLSQLGRELEDWVRTTAEWDRTTLARLSGSIERVASVFDDAAREIGVPQTLVKQSEFGWRALLVGRAGDLVTEIASGLEISGFAVASDDGEPSPQTIPVSARPDLVVIVSEDEGHDPYAQAAAWYASRTSRPRAVVLVDGTGRADRLRAVAAGIDAVYSPEHVADELPKYAKTLARIGVPPPSVLLIQDHHERAETTLAWLEQANLRVTRCEDALDAREALARELPDLILMDAHLPGVDGFTLARLIRQDYRFNLLPIVFLTDQRSVSTEIEALRAGADDFLTVPVDRNLLLQVVLARAERGRRIRELVHRDGLTGLLNHATLMAELEHVVEFAHRVSEPFVFMMLDVDHFKRVNDSHGHLVGDQVLLHVARVFQSTGRASDLIGRYGGEEFGIILRRNSKEGAKVFAEKLRAALATQPATVLEGMTIPVKVSIGVACYPADAETAAELTKEADTALYRAKAGGRDRVEFAVDNP